jgi:hypothetical protein
MFGYGCPSTFISQVLQSASALAKLALTLVPAGNGGTCILLFHSCENVLLLEKEIVHIKTSDQEAHLYSFSS